MILVVLAIAFILRLVTLNQSFWLDEAITAVAIRNNNLGDLVTRFSVGDLHPPLHYIILWFWGNAFGFSEISLRLPSVILGVATVYLTFLIGKELFSKRVALIAGLLMCLAPLHVYYSQEARMYSLAAFAATLSVYFLIRLTKGRKWSWLGLVFANILVLYSDYLVYLILPVQVLYVLMCPYITRWRLIRLYSKVLILSLATLIFWEPVFLVQFSAGTSTAATLAGWADVVGGSSFKDLALIPVKTFIGRVSFENKQIYGLVIGLLGLLYGFIVWYGIKKIDQATKLLLLWIVIPVILAFIISIYIPVLSYFRLIFVLPAFYLLLAKGLNNLSKVYPFKDGSFRVYPWGLVFVCLVNLIFLGMYYVNPKYQREDWRGLVSFVQSKNVTVILENNNSFAPIIYYSGDANFKPGLKKVPATDSADIHEISGSSIYYLEYLKDITDPKGLLTTEINKQSYKKTETINFNGVGFLHHFEK